MQQNSTFKKLIQISEEAFPPLHVSFALGPDCYIITQQDVRKIEESRYLSFSKLMPNGDLKPLNHMAPETLAQLLRLKFLFDAQCSVDRENLFNLINCNANICLEAQQTPQFQVPFSQPYTSQQPFPQPMEISSCPDNRQVASIEQQLKWDKCKNTSAPFPLTYSQGTSATEIMGSNPTICKTQQQNIQTCCSCCCCKTCINRNVGKTVTFSRATYTQDQEPKSSTPPPTANLGAREQLKQKKLNYEFY